MAPRASSSLNGRPSTSSETIYGSRVVDRRVEHRDDVGMVEGAGGPRLSDEALNSDRVGFRAAMKNLQRDVALEAWVPRSIHLASASRTDERQDLVRAK